MTCYGAVQINKHNLAVFLLSRMDDKRKCQLSDCGKKNFAVIKIHKNTFHLILHIHYSGLYCPKDLTTSWAIVDD